MNGKRAKALRKMTASRKQYQAAKQLVMADNGQNPKPLMYRASKPKAAIKPTWPASANQRRQSRPLIVLRPVKKLCEGWSEQSKRHIRASWARKPKHEIDFEAMRG